MALHRLTSINVGCPTWRRPPSTTATSVDPLGKTSDGGRRFATRDGGEQLLISYAPAAPAEHGSRARDRDDLDRVRTSLARLDIAHTGDGDRMTVADPHSRLEVTVEVAPPLVEEPAGVAPTNGPGRRTAERPGSRCGAREPVLPRKLGTGDRLGRPGGTQRFFVEGLASRSVTR